MNRPDTKAICNYYYQMIMSDWRKAGLLLRVMDTMISGGPKLNSLERMFSDEDEGAIVRAASFRMNMAGGGGDDPLARAIAAISD